jgi:hypothetical protein
MYVRGRESNMDKLSRKIFSMTVRDQKKEYYRMGSWLLFYKACYELGEISLSELINLRTKVLSRQI